MKRKKFPLKKIFILFAVVFLSLVIIYVFLFKQVFSSVMIWFPWTDTRLGSIYLTFGKLDITLPIDNEQSYKLYGLKFYKGYVGSKSKAYHALHHDPYVRIKWVERPYQDKYTKANLKTIISKNSGLLFITPEGFESTYHYRGFDGHFAETITYVKGYRMEINIFDKTFPREACTPFTPSQYAASWHQNTVLFAGKYPLIFSSIGDWRKGWVGSTTRVYIEEKQSCIQIYREQNGDVEKYFDKILNEATFDVPWWKKMYN